MRRGLIVLPVLGLMLAGCEGGGDPVQQALRETATANHSARVKETATTSVSEPAGTADRAYISGMIEHHRSAVSMAEAALDESRDPEVRRMAQAVIDARTREIAKMEAWEPSVPTAQ